MKLHFHPAEQDLEIESPLSTVARTIHLNRAECAAITAALNPLVVPRIAHLIAKLRQEERAVSAIRAVGRTVRTRQYQNLHTGARISVSQDHRPDHHHHGHHPQVQGRHQGGNHPHPSAHGMMKLQPRTSYYI